jgi:hypothetical protein
MPEYIEVPMEAEGNPVLAHRIAVIEPLAAREGRESRLSIVVSDETRGFGQPRYVR